MFIISFCSLAVLAQAPPPPPAPLIYKAPEKSELKEFLSDDSKFQVTFPGEPKITKQEFENGFIITYRVYRQGSNSIVSVIEYKNNVEDKREEIIEHYKNTIFNIPNKVYSSTFPPPKITEEKDFQLEGIKGKEFAFESNMQFTKVRLLFVGKKVYEIKSDVTNWHILTKHVKDKVADFEQETKRFFDSFKFLK
jgi:hypothetical protein